MIWRKRRDLKAIVPRERAAEVHAVVSTSHGRFTIRLHHERVPKTCQNFIDLADDGYYDGGIFHRIIDDFMIQGGCPKGNGRGGPGYAFADEFHRKLKHDGPGVLSMANAGKHTNGSQFFITLGPTPHLDRKHSVFGRVEEGLEVVKALGKVRTDGGDRPLEPVRVESITIQRS